MDEIEIIDREEHCRIRCLKEAAYMLGKSDLLSRPSIEMNMIWELLIKKVRSKKNCDMSHAKKLYMIVMSSTPMADGDIRLLSPKNSL